MRLKPTFPKHGAVTGREVRVGRGKEVERLSKVRVGQGGVGVPKLSLFHHRVLQTPPATLTPVGLNHVLTPRFHSPPRAQFLSLTNTGHSRNALFE